MLQEALHRVCPDSLFGLSTSPVGCLRIYPASIFKVQRELQARQPFRFSLQLCAEPDSIIPVDKNITDNPVINFLKDIFFLLFYSN
jgi:hypothetical protein